MKLFMNKFINEIYNTIILKYQDDMNNIYKVLKHKIQIKNVWH